MTPEERTRLEEALQRFAEVLPLIDSTPGLRAGDIWEIIDAARSHLSCGPTDENVEKAGYVVLRDWLPQGATKQDGENIARAVLEAVKPYE